MGVSGSVAVDQPTAMPAGTDGEQRQTDKLGIAEGLECLALLSFSV